MPHEITGQSPERQRLLETVLPSQARPAERTDFARGLALLAKLIDDVVAEARLDKQGAK